MDGMDSPCPSGPWLSFGGGAGLAAFGDVLHSAAGGLDHPVVGAAALADVPVAEPDGHVADEWGELEASEIPLGAVGGEQRVAGHGEPEDAKGEGPLCVGTGALRWKGWSAAGSDPRGAEEAGDGEHSGVVEADGFFPEHAGAADQVGAVSEIFEGLEGG